VLSENISTSDSHAASLEVAAAYAQADLEVIPYVRTTLGVRYEEAEQQVRVFDRLGNPGPGAVLIENDYVLPSALVTWNFAEDLQLRFGYSRPSRVRSSASSPARSSRIRRPTAPIGATTRSSTASSPTTTLASSTISAATPS
jgi:outer membrane receptor protein involved in Fe transport